MKRGIGVVLVGWLVAGVGCGNVLDSPGAGHGGNSGAGTGGNGAAMNRGGSTSPGGTANEGGRQSGGASNGEAGSSGQSDAAGASGVAGDQGEAGNGGSSGSAGNTAGSGGNTAGSGGNTAGSGGNTAGSGGNTAGSGGNTAGSGGNTAGSGGTAGSLNIPCSCSSDKQCIRVTVTRMSDTSRQPWVLWPTQADGTGTLVVSAVTPTYTLQDRVRIPDANFLPPDARYGVALCVPPGTSTVRAFLDHGNDEVPGAVTSSDYLDSCADGSAACFRCFSVPVNAGTDVNLNVGLARSCD